MVCEIHRVNPRLQRHAGLIKSSWKHADGTEIDTSINGIMSSTLDEICADEIAARRRGEHGRRRLAAAPASQPKLPIQRLSREIEELEEARSGIG